MSTSAVPSGDSYFNPSPISSGSASPLLPPMPVVPAVAPVPLPASTSPSEQGNFVRGETTKVWGLSLDRLRMSDAVSAIADMIADRVPRFVITANLNYAMLVDKSAKLQAITDEASLVLADGQPLVWRSKLNADKPLPERVAGSELIYQLSEMAAIKGWRIYFLGAEPGVAQRCAARLETLYPGLQVAGVQSPPYRKLNEAEMQLQRQAIIDSRPDILFVAFGQPKGELWIHHNYKELGVPVSIQIGASFDFVAGLAKRAPKIFQRFGLEWAYRMFHDPKRLVPRYASNAWFMLISLLRDWNEFVHSKFDEAENQSTQLRSR